MAVRATTDPTPRIPSGTAIGNLQLTVPILERSLRFYERLIGLSSVEQPDGSVLLGGAGGSPPLLSLVGDTSAAPHDPRRAGLFHFAILVPTRRDLAAALMRLAQGGWRLDGVADHLVSEALYLQDPDGNGIEISCDRDRSQWQRDAKGMLATTTLPLDLDELLQELETAPDDPHGEALMPAGTRMGHVHLQAAELEQTEAFYVGVLGFDVSARLPGALFVSAGGYHHHIGLNTWNSRGRSAPAPGALGLRAYEIRLGDAAALGDLLARIEAAGIPMQLAADGATLVRDPSGNRILLTI